MKDETERFGARVILIRDDHLGQLPRYVEWVERSYWLVKSYASVRPRRFRRVYVHPDVDLAAVRTTLAEGLHAPARVGIGPAALLGYSIRDTEVARGSPLELVLHWEALQATPPRHELRLRLVGKEGRTVQETRWRVGDGDQELSSWEAGQWQVQSVSLPVENRVPRGAYAVTLALVSAQDETPVEVRPLTQSATAGTELALGTITVR
jgi:hypothetical protein